MHSGSHGRHGPPNFAYDVLSRRVGVASDTAAEAAASSALLETLVREPHAALPRCVEVAVSLCDASSAGVCLLREETGARTLQWEALSGDWSSIDEADRARRLSLCGVCVQGGVPLVEDEMLGPDANCAAGRAGEALLVPLFEDCATLIGVLFIGRFHFCRDDLRIAEWLAHCIELALRLARDGERSALPRREAVDRRLAEERRKRRLAEASNQSLQQLLAAKEDVISEAHHRVKNTLQIAASLLSLQDDVEGESARNRLRQARDRLYVLANVHDLLARRGDEQREVHVPRLLQVICDALPPSFPDAAERVCLRSSAEDMHLPANQAIAVALAANELVTNAYKHAFPLPLGGDISVSFECTAMNDAVLRVEDTGVGIDTDSCIDGLGLRLVRALTDQLRGVLSITRADPGLRIELRIPGYGRLASVPGA